MLSLLFIYTEILNKKMIILHICAYSTSPDKLYMYALNYFSMEDNVVKYRKQYLFVSIMYTIFLLSNNFLYVFNFTVKVINLSLAK